MADERLRERERKARLGGIQDRQAWVSELSRSRAPEAVEAEALQERIAKALQALRLAVDEHSSSTASWASTGHRRSSGCTSWLWAWTG
jgi:hypothetical protein